jgi:hypothetical protein
MVGARQEGERKRTLADPDFARVLERVSDVFIGIQNPRARYARLLSTGVPLRVVRHIDCEGSASTVGLNVIRGVESFVSFTTVEAVGAALVGGGQVVFPEPEPSATRDSYPDSFRQTLDFLDLVVPHFLCSSVDRASFVRGILSGKVGDSVVGISNLSGAPQSAALSLNFAADSYKVRDRFKEALGRLEE